MLCWNDVDKACLSCTTCKLSEKRTNVVIGRGNRSAELLLVGEAPGEQEDLQGLPFVGAAGRLLDLVLDACMFKPDDFYITNIVKCRPPGNRNPEEDEATACLTFLREQFSLIRPKVVVCLGKISSSYLVSKDIHISKDRGVWVEKKGCFFMPTFHPAALLRDESKKLPFWEDMMKVKERLDEIRITKAK